MGRVEVIYKSESHPNHKPSLQIVVRDIFLFQRNCRQLAKEETLPSQEQIKGTPWFCNKPCSICRAHLAVYGKCPYNTSTLLSSQKPICSGWLTQASSCWGLLNKVWQVEWAGHRTFCNFLCQVVLVAHTEAPVWMYSPSGKPSWPHLILPVGMQHLGTLWHLT